MKEGKGELRKTIRIEFGGKGGKGGGSEKEREKDQQTCPLIVLSYHSPDHGQQVKC